MKPYLFLLCTLFCFACSKDKDSGLPDLPDIPEEQATLSISSSHFLFSSDGGTDTLSIASNYTWTITAVDAWCQPSVSSGFGDLDVQVVTKANPDTDDRITRWVINAGRFRSDTVYISQRFKDGNLTFPDDEFQKYLLKNFDKNHDGHLSVSEAREITSIAIQGDNLNLDGLDYFPELRYLTCWPLNTTSQLGIKKLDVSKNKYLIQLFCNNNQLTELDLSQNLGLETLYCSDNKIVTLDLKDHEDLKSLYCSNNQLTTLDCENCSSLNVLQCQNNQLTSLDVTTCKTLTTLYCNDNQITELDLPENAMLENLTCSNNQLTSLDVNSCPNLKALFCGDNPIQNLEITNCPQLASLSLPKQLESLKISNNDALTSFYYGNIFGISAPELKYLKFENCSQLQSVFLSDDKLESVSITFCPLLERIRCSFNQITSLTIDNCNSFKELQCSKNQLTMLDVSGCTSLTALDCASNQLTTLDVSGCTSLETLTCYSNPNLKTIYKKKGQSIDISVYKDVEIIEL